MGNFKNWLKSLIGNLKQVFVRFPLPCGLLLIMSIIWSVITIYEKTDFMDYNMTLFASAVIFGCAVAAVLLFAFALFLQTHNTKKWHRIAGYCTASLFSVASAIILAITIDNDYALYNIYTIVFIALLTLAVLPMIGKRPEQIWNYHAKLVYSCLVSIGFSSVIALSVNLILASFCFLFDFDFYEIQHSSFYIFIFAFFAPCCAMSLMPTEESEYDKPLKYTKPTKILALYILLPLICIESVIIYVYGCKILINWQLPEGSVAYLVLSYAIIGTLIWYLLMPVYYSEEKRPARIFERGFFGSLLPLLGLLFVGLHRRISDYGFTTNRYIVLIIACWFAIISIYALFKKSRKITPPLIALIIISFLSMFGPWSIFSFPYTMQARHFEKIATEYNILVNGKVEKPAEPLTFEQNAALSQSIEFFAYSPYQYKFVEKYFSIPEDSIVKYSYSDKLMAEMNGEYLDEWERRELAEDGEGVIEGALSYYFTKSDSHSQKMSVITGYDYALSLKEHVSHATDHLYKTGGTELIIKTNFEETPYIIFNLGKHTFSINPIDSLRLLDKIQEANNYYIPLQNSEISHEDAKVKLLLDINSIRIEKDSGATVIEEIDFDGYIKVKK